ncbi:MAG: hypothetical protein CFE44_22315 [Burkholderiales bacterium PBB4]|nr:MAG: hypothetical protein CFE44_22315 [Burkholderiales bacterium PBB4]
MNAHKVLKTVLLSEKANKQSAELGAPGQIFNDCLRLERRAAFDPNRKVKLLQSCPMPGPTTCGLGVPEAVVQGHTDPARSGHRQGAAIG